jgi:phosphohistidine phosphatase
MRHGIAVERGDPEYPNDADRPLTDRGRRRTRSAARGLRLLGVRPGRIWTSPYPRAAETAAIVAEVLHLAIDAPREEPLLIPGGSAVELVGALAHLNDEEVLLVGHQPDLTRLASLLLTSNPDALTIDVRKAGVCLLETREGVRAGGAAMQGLWQAGLLRAVASAQK